MNLVMSGLDYSLAPLALREQLTFTKARVEELNTAMSLAYGVAGCVLLSTCNRTELYISLENGVQVAPDQLLCQVAGVEYDSFSHSFTTRQGEDAITHLMEVACGLRSQIWGEDQILTQVKSASTLARSVGSADGLLETVFRTAISAGKAVRHHVRLTHIPTSAAHCGVMALEGACGQLSGKKVMVVGNGEMGRLAAGLLRDKGCQVTITLRSYRHGETVVPAGCGVIPYETRYEAMDGLDILISATTSPHYTVGAVEYSGLSNPPKYLVDLAVPRDIDPALDEIPTVTLFHVDNMGVNIGQDADPVALEQARALLEAHMEKLRRWWNYRNGLVTREEGYPRFPLFVDLSGRRVVVVGGGTVACRRINTLRQFGADITVIAPHWNEPIEGILWLQRPYDCGDLEGATIAVAATNDSLVNHQVGQEANGLGIPVSVADDASACTFYFPAVCIGGDVVAGVVSADGAHHSRTAKAAKAIRKTLEELP